MLVAYGHRGWLAYGQRSSVGHLYKRKDKHSICPEGYAVINYCDNLGNEDLAYSERLASKSVGAETVAIYCYD